MTERDQSLEAIQEGRAKFLELVAEVRPELHRYCARMTGSVTDGEDLVQDTLARAYFALAELETVPPLRPWLFTIAHHRAIDHLRRYERGKVEPLEAIEGKIADDAAGADDALADEEGKASALSAFVDLPPLQRSAVILKDVLDHSLEEIATRLELSVPAVKAALHRGRTRLAARRSHPADIAKARPASAEMLRYVALFNARDWDAVRAMLADDVRLDLVAKHQRSGRRDVGVYYTNYSQKTDWHLAAASLNGREVIAVYRGAGRKRPDYLIEMKFTDGQVSSIRDYRYVDYIARDAAIVVNVG